VRSAVATATTLLLAGCGSNILGSPVDSSQTDTDAARRAADPYHTNPLYNPNVPAAQVYIDKQETSTKTASASSARCSARIRTRAASAASRSIPISGMPRSDTMSFMPIASADPFGGTIITDWYSPRGTPNERFKCNIFILNRELRADGVCVTAFRQTRDASGQGRRAGRSQDRA
jgi:hypothetical protein